MALSELTESILADLPAYYREDEIATSVLDCMAREVERLEETAETIRSGLFVSGADDTYDLLAAHEAQLGLPVRQSGISIAQRRGEVLAAIAARHSPSLTDWANRVSATLGTTEWSYAENTPSAYTITMFVPYEVGTDEYDRVEPAIRPFTPAHIDITLTAGEGFIVGVSAVGEEVI